MFIFFRLILAHCLADFPFQTNYIFRLKLKGPKGVIPHALIVTISCLMLCWPYLHLPQLWYFIAFIGISHFVQDSVKIIYASQKHYFWAYLLDQLFHVAAIALVFLTDLKNIQAPADQTNIFVQLYSNDHLMIYLIVLITATYNGFFLIRSFKASFLGDAGQFDCVEKWYGIYERALIVSAFLLKEHFLLLIPAIILVRPLIFILWRKKFNLPANFISTSEITLSWAIALVCGSVLLLL